MMKRFRLLFLLGCLLITIIIALNSPTYHKWQPVDNVVKLQATDIYGSNWEATAVFIADDLLITAGHCVEDTNSITLTTIDGRKIQAIDWYQEDTDQTDIGIIQVRTTEQERQIDFSIPRFGEEIFAIGNPYGIYPHITKGIISAINVNDDYWGEKNGFMVDAALNPGNSGSAIWNEKNEIVGIHVGTIIMGNNFCFCIPGPIVKLVLEKYSAIQALKGAE